MGRKSKNAATWAEAKTKCRMNAEDVEMAKQLGLSPRTLIANNSSTRQELWKSPTRYWVRDMYEKRFGKTLSKPVQGKAPRPPQVVKGFHEDELYGSDLPALPTQPTPNRRDSDEYLDDPFADD